MNNFNDIWVARKIACVRDTAYINTRTGDVVTVKRHGNHPMLTRDWYHASAKLTEPLAEGAKEADCLIFAACEPPKSQYGYGWNGHHPLGKFSICGLPEKMHPEHIVLLVGNNNSAFAKPATIASLREAALQKYKSSHPAYITWRAEFTEVYFEPLNEYIRLPLAWFPDIKLPDPAHVWRSEYM